MIEYCLNWFLIRLYAFRSEEEWIFESHNFQKFSKIFKTYLVIDIYFSFKNPEKDFNRQVCVTGNLSTQIFRSK